MNINATLFVQMVVFFIGAWVTMKFIWPPLRSALDERRSKIEAGLAAARDHFLRGKCPVGEMRVEMEVGEHRSNAECGVRSAEFGLRNAEWRTEMENVE